MPVMVAAAVLEMKAAAAAASSGGTAGAGGQRCEQLLRQGRCGDFSELRQVRWRETTGPGSKTAGLSLERHELFLKTLYINVQRFDLIIASRLILQLFPLVPAFIDH